MILKKIKLLIALACFTTIFDAIAIVPAKVLICGVCKNVEPFLQNDVQNIEELGNHFENYYAVICENNSNDRTSSILANWAKLNDHVMIISEYLSQEQLMDGALCHDWQGNPSRMELIARARNRVLEVIKRPQFDDFDFVIMADLDFSCRWPINEIVNTIQNRGHEDWDCVTANGMQRGIYYDRYAFRDHNFPFGPELLGEPWWQNLERTPYQFHGDQWVPVYSAFGGLAIYKRKSILQSSYDGHVTDDQKLMVKSILISLGGNHPEVQKYLNLIGHDGSTSLENIPIVFQLNSGYYHFPTCCEHVTLHASMFLHGYNRIFINPQMMMSY